MWLSHPDNLGCRLDHHLPVYGHLFIRPVVSARYLSKADTIAIGADSFKCIFSSSMHYLIDHLTSLELTLWPLSAWPRFFNSFRLLAWCIFGCLRGG